ncbi:MAG: protein kinase [Isosphaeraceae bacterium]|nr:protein kinase [Isosphaeraceae bacterium]
MIIQCPHCQHSIGLKSTKPGRYATKCPKCAERFQLTVPDDPNGTPKVKPLPSEAPATVANQATGAWDPNATAPQPAAQAAETVAATGVYDPNATGDFSAPAPRPAATELATAAHGFDVADGGAGRPEGVPALLGGYQVLKELGRGGMGAVYLARQLSLDRNVALKVMKPEWASNPTFVSRFTREAYAAAQLVHHNVVQIYDFGEDRGTNFFSMEFVQGRTLTDLLREKKKLDPEVAAGYVLQAARGLKYAHDQSMIHRDIKPDNLMLNDQGVVKVADLGLVKTPAMAEAEVAAERGNAAVLPPGRTSLAVSSGQITIANVAMGTPAFMAPEQARDASSVDARADIYSLGCTLYDLVTGRPPFEGKTAIELITKHQNEPVVPPERLAPRVPKDLSEIIMKMIAKKPEERYSNLADVIKALEDYLGIQSSGVFSPREEHANLLEESVRQFNAAPTARLRPKLLLGGLGACALIVLVSLFAGQFRLAAGFLGLGVMASFVYFVLDGLTRKSPLFLKTRELVLGGSVSDWLTIVAGVVLIFALVFVFKMFWPLVAFGIVAAIVAWGLHSMIDRKVEAERHEPVEQVEQMIRGLRLKGLDEETLRQFVCKYSGDAWEEFYEELFGYEAKLIARDKWGRSERGRPRPKFAAWRDPIIRAIEAKQQARRAAREQKLLQKIEEKGLEAQGVNLLTARRKARRAAEAMVATAAEVRASARAAEVQGGERLSIGKSLKHAADKPEDVLSEQETGPTRPRLDGPLNLVLGGRTRFLAGAALIAGCLIWMDQNKILDTEQIKATASEVQGKLTKAAESKDVGGVMDVKVDTLKHVNQEAINQEHRPLEVPGLPGFVRNQFNSFNPGIAGLILVVSSFFRGWRMSLFALPAAGVALLGPSILGVPSSRPLDIKNLTTMAAGAVLLVAGFFLGRAR